MKQLITFIGRAPKHESKYRTTTYDFQDGLRQEPVAFFGWLLNKKHNPDHTIILGTSGSMWDHLFEGDIDLGNDGENRRLGLVVAVEKKDVTQQQLDELSPLLSKHLNTKISLIIIPYCQTEEEQIELLRIMADQVEEGSQVEIDVTHGFRHLPMLAMLSALHLRIAKQADIQKIWYATYDPDTEAAPVYDLSGLLKIADWLQALSSFDSDGDYRSFIPLLKKSGMPTDTTQALAQAGYFENVLNVGDATGKLRQATSDLENEENLSPDTKLLLPLVKKRLDWINENKQFEKQCKLGEQALKRGDYLRSVLYAYEAVITRLCQQTNSNIDNFIQRENSRKKYEKRLKEKGKDNAERKQYNQLKQLRNQIAHGARGTKGDIQKILLDETKLRSTLKQLLDKIKNHSLPSDPQKKTNPASQQSASINTKSTDLTNNVMKDALQKVSKDNSE